MNIFILGGNSFIVKNFIRKYNQTGFYNFILYGRRFDCFYNDHEGINFIEDDFTSITYDFNLQEESVLVMSLWQTNPSTSVSLSQEINLNYDPYKLFLELLPPQNIKHIIFFSSSAVYGDQCSIPISEDNTPSPLNFYGIVKLKVENLILEYCYKNNIKVTILRMTNVYGPYQHKQGLISTIIRNYNNKLPTKIWDDPNTLRDYIFVDDVSDLIHKIINNKSVHTIINASYGVPYKISDIINFITINMKMNIDIIFKESRLGFDQGTMKNNHLSRKLASTEFQWTPKVDVLSGIKKLVNNGI